MQRFSNFLPDNAVTPAVPMAVIVANFSGCAQRRASFGHPYDLRRANGEERLIFSFPARFEPNGSRRDRAASRQHRDSYYVSAIAMFVCNVVDHLAAKAIVAMCCRNLSAATYPSGVGNAVAVGAPRSWRDPAGGSPARVSRSGRSVASVAWRKATTVAKRTQQSLRGGLLSRERAVNAEAEAVDRAEGNISNAVMRGAATLPWSKTPSRMKGSHRNVGELAIDRMAFCHAARVGKAMSRSRR
jgi:hypothetical protein